MTHGLTHIEITNFSQEDVYLQPRTRVAMLSMRTVVKRLPEEPLNVQVHTAAVCVYQMHNQTIKWSNDSKWFLIVYENLVSKWRPRNVNFPKRKWSILVMLCLRQVFLQTLIQFQQ